MSLLKIDVERAELEVLQGLDGADWSRVQQVAMEVHDTGSWQAGASGGSEQAAGSSGGLTSGDGDLTSASSSNAVGPSISGGSGSASSGSSSRLLSGSGRGGGGANGAGAAPAGTGGRLAAVRALLAAAGLTRICVEQDVLLTGTTLHNVYAMRQHRGG